VVASTWRAASLGVLTIVAVFTISCERPIEPSPLIGDLSSGLGKAAVAERLGPLAVALTEEPPQEIDGGAPSGGVTVDRLRLAGFNHLGHEGELTLTFYNDQLVMAIFRPAEPEDYVSALSNTYSNDFTSSRETRVDPRTTVWYTTNKQEGSFAGWEDRELVNRYDTYTER
jgi:hypothetical protein